MLLQGVDFVCQPAGPGRVGMLAESDSEYGTDFRIHEVRFRSVEGMLHGPVQHPGEIKAFEPVLLKNPGPFGCFKGNAVGSGKTSGNEADIFTMINGDIHFDTFGLLVCC